MENARNASGSKTAVLVEAAMVHATGSTTGTSSQVTPDVPHDSLMAQMEDVRESINRRNKELRVLRASHDALVSALQEIIVICNEDQQQCRRRMGTRVGNCLVTARAALAQVTP